MMRTAVAILILAMAGGANASVATHETTLYNFTQATGSPSTGLVAGGKGVFYFAAGRSIYSLSQNAAKRWQVKLLYTFGKEATALPRGLIVSGGVIYGIDGETIFALTPSKTTPVKWTESIIYTFTPNSTGPYEPVGMVSPGLGIIGLTTESGGGATACGMNGDIPVGCGTIFALYLESGKWTGSLVHAFQGDSDGATPLAAPSLDSDGNLYASTYLGGYVSDTDRASSSRAHPLNPEQGAGTVMRAPLDKKTKRWQKKVQDMLRWIKQHSQDELAKQQLQYLEGEIYNIHRSMKSVVNAISSTNMANIGIALSSSLGGGDPGACEQLGNGGCGDVFSFTEPADGPTGSTLQKLHDFTGPDGEAPYGGFLVNGSLIYGIATGGNRVCAYPARGGCGVIYAVEETASGFAYAGTAYKFSGVRDGALPNDGLVAWKGQILGTTSAGGKNNLGVIFALTP